MALSDSYRKPLASFRSHLPITSQWRRLMPMIIVGLVYLVIGVLFLVYFKDLLPVLERLAEWLRSHGIWGLLLLASLICLTGFPFMPGYSTLVTMSGFVFGVPLGFLTAFMLCICRRWARNYTEKLAASSRHLSAVLHAVERRGWKLLLLIRVAPYLQSAKCFVVHDGYLIPANLVSLVDAFQHPSAGKIALATVGGLVGAGITIYLYIVARRAVAEDEAFGIHHPNIDMAFVGDADIAMEEGPWQLGSSDEDDDDNNDNAHNEYRRFHITSEHHGIAHTSWNGQYSQVAPAAPTPLPVGA
ncbi:hypothetical protein BDF22DRAFT_740977 [Syncephalis plumigaleata]|nr:hypothetical protein BDF22DRAFT_740977 [Syncephalis plumigaleata]